MKGQQHQNCDSVVHIKYSSPVTQMNQKEHDKHHKLQGCLTTVPWLHLHQTEQMFDGKEDPQ